MTRLVPWLLLALFAPAVQALTLLEQLPAPGHWGAIVATNTASSVDPDRDPAANPRCPAAAPWRGNGYAGKWKSWNSGIFVPSYGPCGAIIHYGGGHNDYWGSDLTALNLCGPDGPVWERLNNPYGASSYVWPIADGRLPDGSPVPQHTYDTLAYDPGTNSLITLNAMSSGPASTTTPTLYQFDLDTRQWSGPFTHKGARYGVAAYDSLRGLVWFQPQLIYPGEFTSYNPATNEFTYYGLSTGVGGLDAMLGYDPVRDRLVIANLRSSGKIAERRLSDPTVQWKVAEQVNKPATVYGQGTWAWSPQREAWISWQHYAGPQVWEVKRTGENPTTGAAIYTWTALLSPSNTVLPGNTGNGPYEKFQLVNVGGSEILIGQLTLPGGIFAFRLPDVQVASRCDGAFVCEEFDTLKTGSIKPGDTTPRVEDGELVFSILSGSSANAGGHVRWTFPAIGEGDFLAFAYRVKADQGATALMNPGRKEFILWRGASSCTDLELSQSHRRGTPIVHPYTHCGNFNFLTKLGQYDYRMHYPDYDCTYHGSRTSLEGCVITHADIWESFYVELALGVFGQPNTRVTMWHRSAAEPWRRYIERDDYTFYGSGGFDHFMLTTYMTGKDRTVEHPPGEVRYDYLVMSSQPIDKALL